MARALIQTANQSDQNVAVNSIISLGSVLRRYGCGCRLSGNAIELEGEGYFAVDASVSVSPTAAGAVTVALFADGVQVPGAIAYGTGTAAAPVALPITTTIRRGCCGNGADMLTLVLVEGAGVVNNVSLRVVKE